MTKYCLIFAIYFLRPTRDHDEMPPRHHFGLLLG